MIHVHIKNGMLVDKGEIRPLDVLIEGEKVQALVPRDTPVEAERVIDATGQFVLPGLIDAHNHPVYADRIDRLSMGALSGGITTVIPYIGAVAAWGKKGGLVQAIEDFISEGEQDSRVDFSVHCTLTENVMAEMATAIPQLFERGVVSYKAFTSYKKRGMKIEDEAILELMDVVATKGGLLAFHAENGALLDYLENKAIAENREHPRFFPGTHPNLSEAEAVFRVLTLAASTKCPMYLPHITCAESLAVIKQFRQWDVVPELFVETCPHYLLLTEEAMESAGNKAKMSPPLRTEADRLALWQALADKEIEVIGSDAAGQHSSAKEPLFDKMSKAPNGCPGVDTLFTSVWDEGINTGRMSVIDLVRVMCENPARIFGIYPQKGTLQVGADADVVLVDPNIAWQIPESCEHMHVDYSLIAGRKCLGRHTKVLLRGQKVWDNGTLLNDARKAHFLPGKLA